MKARSLLGAAVGLVGTAAVGNRILARNVSPLGPPLGRETGSYRWRGMEISYTEGGDPEAPDLLLVHSIHRAGTSREFNRIFERLAESYHVIAPDLPGFGRSDRPPMLYSAALYETFLEDLIEDVTDQPVIIGSGVGGAYSLAASRHVDTDRVVLICPTTETFARTRSMRSRMMRLPVVGTAGFNLITSRRGFDRFARTHLLYDPHSLSEDDREYFWQTAHQPNARYPIAAAAAGHLEPTVDPGSAIATRDTDGCVIWGREARVPSLAEGRRTADRANIKLIVMDQARRLPHFEQPGVFFDILDEELRAAS